jgi:hypothetical protein
MAKKIGKKVATKQNTQVAVSEARPDWMDDTGRGSEEVGFDDMTIPRLDVIQDLSPQHKKNKPEYIEDAEPGILFNTVTSVLYGTSVKFIPVYFRKEWVIWKDIKAGGGFRGAHATQQEAVNALSELDDADQCDIQDTGQHFGLIVNLDGSVEDICISMSKSKMKASRQLNSMVKIRGGDRFSSMYDIKAIEAQNAAGQDYWNIAVKPLGFVSKELYAAGEALYEQVKLGTKDVDRKDGDDKEEDRDF